MRLLFVQLFVVQVVLKYLDFGSMFKCVCRRDCLFVVRLGRVLFGVGSLGAYYWGREGFGGGDRVCGLVWQWLQVLVRVVGSFLCLGFVSIFYFRRWIVMCYYCFVSDRDFCILRGYYSSTCFQYSFDSWVGKAFLLQLICGDQRGGQGVCRQILLGRRQREVSIFDFDFRRSIEIQFDFIFFFEVFLG